MGTNTTSDVSDGSLAKASDLNQYNTAIKQDFVPRNSSGAPTSSGGELGTSTYKWSNLHLAGNATIDGDATITGDVTITTNHTNYEPLGTVKSSLLTVSQYQTIMGTNWVLMDGSSCAGSDFATLTSITTLPNLVDGSALVQTDTDGNISNLTTGDVKSHSHTVKTEYLSGGVSVATFTTAGEGAAVSTNTTGGTDNLAAGVKVNFFIKINN